jgi:hypothetical protein
MRTTVKLDDDVVAAIDQLRAKENLGFSEAVNRLARAGASVVGAGLARHLFVQPTFNFGEMMDVANVAEALEFAELHDDR